MKNETYTTTLPTAPPTTSAETTTEGTTTTVTPTPGTTTTVTPTPGTTTTVTPTPGTTSTVTPTPGTTTTVTPTPGTTTVTSTPAPTTSTTAPPTTTSEPITTTTEACIEKDAMTDVSYITKSMISGYPFTPQSDPADARPNKGGWKAPESNPNEKPSALSVNMRPQGQTKPILVTEVLLTGPGLPSTAQIVLIKDNKENIYYNCPRSNQNPQGLATNGC